MLSLVYCSTNPGGTAAMHKGQNCTSRTQSACVFSFQGQNIICWHLTLKLTGKCHRISSASCSSMSMVQPGGQNSSPNSTSKFKYTGLDPGNFSAGKKVSWGLLTSKKARLGITGQNPDRTETEVRKQTG